MPRAPKFPPILPGLEAPEGGWKELSLTALPRAEIMPGHVIMDFGSFKQVNTIEEAACSQVALLGDARSTDGLGIAIANNRLADMLRPPGFNGSLLEAHALVFPFNAERVKQYESFRKNYFPAGKEGLTFLFMANMRSRAAVRDVLFAEVSYYEGAGARMHSQAVTRLLGGVTIASVQGGFRQAAKESTARAYEVASYAMRHVYQAGLPGLGKHK